MKLAIVAAALLLPASSPASPPERAAEAPRPARVIPVPDTPGGAEMPNMAVTRPGCRPILQQVRDETKRRRGDDARRLDREPMAFGFLAVDRNIDGCREVTFLNGEGPPPAPLPGR